MWIWLDDERDPLTHWPEPQGDWTWVTSVRAARALLLRGNVEVASLDNDLGGGPEGRELVLWMAEKNIWPSYSCYVHSSNTVAAEYMRGMIDRYGPY